LVEVDREAERIWSDLHRTRVWLGQRPGAAPDPAPATAQPPIDIDGNATTALLTRAAERIHGGRLGPGASRKLPVLVPPLLPFLGAAATAATALLAGALVAIANLDLPGAGLLRVLGWLAYFASPFMGIPVAARWVSRRWSARLDAGAVVLTVLGGLVSLCAVIAVLT
jgi:hypothetical protein